MNIKNMKFENFGQVYQEKHEKNEVGVGVAVDSVSGNNTKNQEIIQQEDESNENKVFDFINALEELGEDIDRELGEITEDNYSERVMSLKNIISKYKQNLEEFADVIQNDRDDYVYVLTEQMEMINKKIVEYKKFNEEYNKNRKKEDVNLEDGDDNHEDSSIEKSSDNIEIEEGVVENRDEQTSNSNGDDSAEKLYTREELNDRKESIEKQKEAHIANYEQVWQVGTEKDKKAYLEKRDSLNKEYEQINEKQSKAEERLEESLREVERTRIEFAQKKVLSDKMEGFFGSGPSGQIMEEAAAAKAEYLDSQKKYADEFLASVDGKISIEVSDKLLHNIKIQEFAKLDFEENKIKFHDRKQSFGKFMSGKMAVALSLRMGKIDDFFSGKNKKIEKFEQNSDVLDMAQKIKENSEIDESNSGKRMVDSEVVKSILFDEGADNDQKDISKEVVEEELKNVQKAEYESRTEEGNEEVDIKFENAIKPKEKILKERREKLEQELERKTESIWKNIRDRYGIDQKIHNLKVKFGAVDKDWFDAEKSHAERMNQKLEADSFEFEKYNEMFRSLLDTRIGAGKRIVLEDKLVNDIENSKVVNLPEEDVKKFQEIKLLIGGVLHESSNSNNETLKEYSERVVEEMHSKCVKNKNCNDVEFENFSRIFNLSKGKQSKYLLY